MRQCWQKSTILLVAIGITTARPGWSDVPSTADPIYSQSFCLKIFEGVVAQARSSTWKIADRDRQILNRCQAKFPPVTNNSQIPLPNASECMDVVKTLVRDGLSKVQEIELPAAQTRSIARCNETIEYYALPSENMLPTLKPNERVVVDKTAYETQSPQRGDIIAFNPNNLPSAQPPQPLIQRAIGLPGDKVLIAKGKVYINGKSIREDYITQPVADVSASMVVPAHSYFMLGDNRNNPSDGEVRSPISREAIVGRVIWHFSSKEQP